MIAARFIPYIIAGVGALFAAGVLATRSGAAPGASGMTAAPSLYNEDAAAIAGMGVADESVYNYAAETDFNLLRGDGGGVFTIGSNVRIEDTIETAGDWIAAAFAELLGGSSDPWTPREPTLPPPIDLGGSVSGGAAALNGKDNGYGPIIEWERPRGNAGPGGGLVPIIGYTEDGLAVFVGSFRLDEWGQPQRGMLASQTPQSVGLSVGQGVALSGAAGISQTGQSVVFTGGGSSWGGWTPSTGPTLV